MGQDHSVICNYDCTLDENNDWECSSFDTVAQVLIERVIIHSYAKTLRTDLESSAIIIRNYENCTIKQNSIEEYDLRMYRAGRPVLNIPIVFDLKLNKKPYLGADDPFFAIATEGFCDKYRIPVVHIPRTKTQAQGNNPIFSMPMDAVGLRWKSIPIDHFGNICDAPNVCKWTVHEACAEAREDAADDASMNTCTSMFMKNLNYITEGKRNAKPFVSISDMDWKEELRLGWDTHYPKLTDESNDMTERWIKEYLCDDGDSDPIAASTFITTGTVIFMLILPLALYMLYELYRMSYSHNNAAMIQNQMSSHLARKRQKSQNQKPIYQTAKEEQAMSLSDSDPEPRHERLRRRKKMRRFGL